MGAAPAPLAIEERVWQGGGTGAFRDFETVGPSLPSWGRRPRRITIARDFESTVRAHDAGVRALLGRLLRDTEDAHDVGQETWFAVWRRWEGIARRDDPWPYIRRAALRKAWDRLRLRRARPETAASSELADPAPGSPAPTIDLSALPEEQRACLTLFFWEGLSVREIAARLRVPEGTVKTWMFRARRTLRQRLQKEEGP